MGINEFYISLGMAKLISVFLMGLLFHISVNAQNLIISSDSCNSYIEQGDKYENAKEYQAAKVYYTKAIACNNLNDGAYFHRGIMNYSLSLYTLAYDDLSKAISIKQIAQYYYCRAIVGKKNKSDSIVLADFNAAIQLSPRNVQYFMERAQLKSRMMNMTQGAIDDYSAAIALNAEYPLAYYGRGLAYASHYNHLVMMLSWKNEPITNDIMRINELAVNDLNVAERLYLQYKNIPFPAHGFYFDRANIKSTAKDYLGAVKDYAESIRIDSTKDLLIYFQKGKAEFFSGKYEDAIADFKISLRFIPDDIESVHWLGKSYAAIKEYKKALEYYDQMMNDQRIKFRGNNDKLYIERADIKKALNDKKGADEDYLMAEKLKSRIH